MTIQLVHIKVRDLFNGYQDNGLNGVVAYGGKLDVRPAYQREFVYKPEQQQAVIDTLSKSYPLNVMYWAEQGDGHYELIDGQQRTLSIWPSSSTLSSLSIYAMGQRARSSSGSRPSISQARSLLTKSYAMRSMRVPGYRMPSATSARRAVSLTDSEASTSRERLSAKST